MLKNTEDRYGIVARALHWGMALMIFCLAGVGLYMTSLPQDHPNIGTLYTLHKSFGVVFLGLLLIRLGWLIVSPPPPLPAALAKGEVALSHAVKGLLYLLMIGIPVSGYLASTLAGYKVNVFGWFILPALFAKSEKGTEIASEAHEVMTFVLLALVVVHVLGAVKHRLKGNPEADVLRRMW